MLRYTNIATLVHASPLEIIRQWTKTGYVSIPQYTHNNIAKSSQMLRCVA